MVRCSELLRRAGDTEEAAALLHRGLASLPAETRQCDDGASELPALVAGYAEMICAGGEVRTVLEASLDRALELRKLWPDSLPVHQLVLACALANKDRERALAVAAAPMPRTFAGLHDVALVRAKACVLLELQAGRATSSDLDRVLADLERVQGDSRDAEYLRTVCACWRACRPGGGDEALREARQHLECVAWGPADAGWWSAASARLVVDTRPGALRDWSAAMRVFELCDHLERDAAFTPYAAQVFLDPAVAASRAQEYETRVLERMQGPGLAVTGAAAAAFRGARGEVDLARRHAAAALVALEQPGAGVLDLDSGVLAIRGLDFSVNCNARGVGVTIRPTIDFWIVPKVPGVERLKELADGK
jgi:hypothetical protein